MASKTVITPTLTIVNRVIQANRSECLHSLKTLRLSRLLLALNDGICDTIHFKMCTAVCILSPVCGSVVCSLSFTPTVSESFSAHVNQDELKFCSR